MDFKQHRRDVHGIGGFQENLRQIVFGGNDGIVTTFAVVAGFAGAQADGSFEVGIIAVIIFGFANLFADATSMGLGEFLSSRSEKDVYNATRASEMHQIHTNRQAEQDELTAILKLKDLSDEDAQRLSAEISRHPELLADFMMNYEFEMADPTGSNPAVNALYTFFSFLFFGVIPLLPYVLGLPIQSAFQVSVAATAFALFLLGLFRWRITRENMLRSVFETMLVGGVCAVVAYGVGWMIGG